MIKYNHIYQNDCFGENWFTFPELYKQVVEEASSRSVFVEVGCWKGKSSAYMAVEIANSQKDITFYCVDTWTGSKEHEGYSELQNLYNIFLENMNPVSQFYFPLKITSLEASKKFKDNSVDFVFLDAAHDYQNAKQDILAWWPKVKVGGILAGHDYWDNPSWGDVKRVVDELFLNEGVKVQENCFLVNKH